MREKKSWIEGELFGIERNLKILKKLYYLAYCTLKKYKFNWKKQGQHSYDQTNFNKYRVDIKILKNIIIYQN